jgi:predicted NACHT family NTPase
MNDLIDRTAVATGVVTKLAEDGACFFWNKVKKYFKDISAQEDITLGIAYETYLSRTKEKYGKIKTLIYKRIKEELYSFYVHVKLKYGDKEVDSSDINNLMELTNKMIITGTGGIGKSTLMHHLFLNTIDKTECIPVLIELRSINVMNDEISIRKSIYETLTNYGFNLEDEYFEYSLNEGGYIFFFDGYDEMNKSIVDKATKDIQNFADKYPRNHYIVSSRPSQEFIGWKDFDELTSVPLSKEQAIELISKLKYDQAVKNKFLHELDNILYDKHKSFAQNPLLLTIMFLTFESNAKIPETLNDFYERAFNVLFREHDATKDVYERETCTKLSYEKFKLIFSYICFISYIQKEYEFTDVTLLDYLRKAQDKFQDILFDTNDYQQDLLQHVCMLVKDGLSYRFVHRSFQEYFAAVYTTSRLIDDKQKNYSGLSYLRLLLGMRHIIRCFSICSLNALLTIFFCQV